MIEFNNLILLGIAALNCLGVYLAYRTKQDMMKVEIATNSMKDALVKSTAEASFAAGSTEARKEGEHKAAELAARNKPHEQG